MLLLALLAPWAANGQTLNEGFESTTFPPDDWTTIHVSGGSSWVRSTGTGASTSSAFAYRKDISGGYNDYLITPKLVPQTGDELSFYLASQYSSSYAGTTLTIEVSTTTPTVDAFTTVLATYNSGSSGNFGTTGSSNWVEKTVDVSAYIGQEIYIAFHATDPGYNADVRIDNVSGVSLYVPSCSKPTTLTATAPYGYDAAHCILLQWEDGSGSYNVQLKKASESEEQWQSIAGGFSDYALLFNTLDPLTTYNARVQSVCGGDVSDWKNVTFTTACAAISVDDDNNYTYGFEDAEPFECWTAISGTVTRISGTTHADSYRLDFRGTTSNMIAFPQFTNATNTLRVEFWTRPESNGGSSGKFAVGYMTDLSDASTFVAVETYNSTTWTSLDYVKKTVDLVSAPANAIIVFRQFDCSTNYYWYVDDVTVKPMPSCVAPTALNANASTNSAELSWTANSGETAWTLYYKKTTDENYTEVTNVTENPYTLSGLTAASNYQFYVIANCTSTDNSEPSNEKTFATECEVIPAVGYSENFDDYTGTSYGTTNILPNCWNYVNTCSYSSYSGFPNIYNTSSYASSSPNSLRFYSYYSSWTDYDPQPQYAILPEMSGLAGMQVTLMAKGYNATSTFRIGTMSDPTDASTFTEITEQTGLTTSYQEFIYIIPSSTTDRYVAIMIDAADATRTSNGVYIDDIAIANPPACAKPTGLATTNPYGHGATLSWTSDASAWVVAYKAANEEEFTEIPNVTVNPYTIAGLNPETTYSVKVKADCGGIFSEYTNTVNFTTTVSCPAPTSLTGEANEFDATITWQGTASTWEVFYSDDNTVTPDDNIDGTATSTTYTKTGLPLGDHYFWVRAICGGEDGNSTWAGPVSVHIGYCVPNPTSHDGNGITGVTFGMGSNVVENGDGTTSLPASAPFYGDYSSMIGAVQAGVESTISITTATSSYPYVFVIWVDLDNSMSFEDSEVLYVGKAASGVGTHTATITIPATQATGDYRMRIYGADSYFSNFYNNGSTNWEAAHDPCANGTYRHAHDYTVRVLEAPSCLTPTNVAISYTSGTSAEITWDGTATSYNIDINGTVTNNVTSPYTLPLELSTTYTVMVQANCGASGTSEWSNSASYTSPDCWGGHLIEYTLTDSYNDGWEDAYIYIKGKCGEIIQTLTVASGASPYSGTLNLCGDYYEIVYKQGGYPSEYAWTFTEGGSTLFTGSGSSSTDGQVFYTIGTISCSVPTNLSNEAPTINSALLSWEENGTAVAWQLCINDDMDNLVEVVQNDLTSTSGNTRSYNLSGLNQETPYTVKVRAKCSATDQSCWSEEVSFTTLASCVKPTDLTVTYTGGTEATISWTSEATVWNMRVNGVDVNGVITNPYTLTGLELATTYEVEVQANCGSNGTSEWTSPVSFTTDLCMPADQCEITMVLNDSYGDGWNGGQLSVVDVLTDQVLGTYTLSSGNSETYTLGVCNGRDINFVYAAGNFGTENGWVITDINNEVITEREGCNSGCTPTDGVQATYTVNCTVNPCKTPKDLTVGTVESQSAELSWTGEMTTYNIRYRHPQTNPTAPATIILEANDVWGDGSGYQMLLDADATAYGTLWNAQHNIFVDGVQYSGGDIPATYYDEFEYKVPTEADGSLSTTNVVVTGTVTITIPAGIYDYVFLNPTPGDKFYVAADNGNVGGAEDNFVFEPGVTYHFTMQQIDGTTGDGAMLTVTPISDWVVVENVTSTSYTLTGLTPLSMYECQVKGFSSECTEGTEWSESVTFTTDVPSFTKTILANSWYALSSPVNTPNVTDVTNLTDGDYDFYRYNEVTSTWENYKAHRSSNFTTFENGRGYIYRNSTGNDLTFTGVPNTATNYPYLLTAEGSGDLAGFNLLGNPYATDYNYSGVCYNLTEKGTWKVNATGYDIPVCEAVLIKVESETPCSFTSSKSAPKAAEVLAFTVSGNGYEDVTYAMLEDGKGLNKVAHLADEAPALSIPVDGSNYAIAYLGYEVESFPLTLNATAGEYTIALNNQISGLSYCHLLDKVTGKETDLLKGAYTFKANGNSDRFTVLLNASLENGEIAIWNGNSWIVNGEGTLQVFDVMGRRVYNQEVAGQSSLNTDELATGVYVIRLGEKSQKIVVK